MDNNDAALIQRLEQQLAGEALTPAQMLDFLLATQDTSVWFTDDGYACLAHFRDDPITWPHIVATAQQYYLTPHRLESAVDAWRAVHDPQPYSVRLPTVRQGVAPRTPPLPAHIACARPDWMTWLDEYAAHSAYWAPRAAPGYHVAVGLWVLSTIAARRIRVQLGSTPIYPTLFLALVAPSTSWTKTTCASIGIQVLRRAGCGHLLAPDRTSPQFLLKIMSGLVPQNYGQKTEEEQEQARHTLAFSGQRGWFYEEWGGMLKNMRRVDSPQSELNKLLIVLEGGAESFETGTIQRGLERVVNPYLALLGNATPYDLAPFMAEGDAWWHDGFWPRFAIVTPPQGATPSRAPRPREAYHLPAKLLLPLSAWYQRLGIPEVTIEEEREANDKKTGAWVGEVGPLPCQDILLAEEVYDQYEAYNDALLDLVQQGVSPDLAAWYGRAHEKALRVAMLLASVHGETQIDGRYWAEGQCIVEGWRTHLHTLIETVADSMALTREERLEHRIESLCAQRGALTAREIQQLCKGASADSIQKTVTSMVQIGTLNVTKEGRRNLYSLFNNEHEENT